MLESVTFNLHSHIRMIYKLKHHIGIYFSFVLFVAKRFHQERCFDIANSLSYTSLLSIVPLMAVVFAGLSSFPVFQDLMLELENFIFSNFIPTSTEVIREYLMSFVGKASSLTLIGIFSLLCIALLLMWKVDQVLNHIWAVTKKRNYLKTFLTYWAILTLGPVLIGLSLMATSYLTSLPIITDTAQTIGVKKQLLQMVAIFFTFMAFSLTYLVVPNTRVNIKNALIGGIVATILFELSKMGFAMYISSNKTYQNIYGALATIPIFLIWIYISWLVILVGAITSRSLDLFDFSQTGFKQQNKFVSASYIIFYLWKKSQYGTGMTEYELLSKQQLGKGKELFEVIKKLEKTHWIHQDDIEQWHLSRDISSLTFKDLYNDLPFELPKTVDKDLLKTILLPIISTNNQHLDINMKIYMENYYANSAKELSNV
ncbi:MAG: YihY family inner membrane protein [Pseudomonadota bacterium]